MSERWVIVTEFDGEDPAPLRVFGPSKEDTGRCTFNTPEEAEEAAHDLPVDGDYDVVRLEEIRG